MNDLEPTNAFETAAAAEGNAQQPQTTRVPEVYVVVMPAPENN